MRVVLLLVAVAACGRLGFDEEAAAPEAEPLICNARAIGPLSLDGAPVKVRATKLSTGFALAVQTELVNTYLMRLDTAGNVVSTHTPLVGGYELQGISQLQDRPMVYVFVENAGYIKLLREDWNSYDTAASSQLAAMDPQQATASSGDYAIIGSINADQLTINGIDLTNTILGAADYAPPATFASFGAIPTGARVVVAKDGVCQTFTIDDDGPTGLRHEFSPCFEPRLATLGSDGAVLYRTSPDGPLAVHQIPANPGDAGSTLPLEIGSNPRIAAIDGAIWVGYLRGAGTLRLVRIVGETSTTHDDDSISTSFDLIGNAAFWVTPSGELHAGAPCL